MSNILRVALGLQYLESCSHYIFHLFLICWFFFISGNFFSIEDPHNSIHLAVGGFDNTQWNYESTVGFKFHKSDVRGFGWHPGANGDLGHNEIAAFDPIFWIFHCNFGMFHFMGCIYLSSFSRTSLTFSVPIIKYHIQQTFPIYTFVFFCWSRFFKGKYFSEKQAFVWGVSEMFQGRIPDF